MSDLRTKYIQQQKEESEKKMLENNDLISSFIHFSKSKNIELKQENFSHNHLVGIKVTEPDILLRINEDLVPDKDGLLDYKLLCVKFKKQVFSHGYFFAENYVMFSSKYFRRDFNSENGFQPRFIEKFWNIQPSDYEEIKILLEFDTLKIDSAAASLELDTWYGASFTNEIASISDQQIKLRPSADFDDDDISLFFSNAYSVDIKWSTSKNIKTFQAEEFKTELVTIEIDHILYFPVRYIHAEYDLCNNTFRHFDGAIHFYTEEEYFQRRDSDLNYNSKSASQIKSVSKKIFKINGTIAVDTWIDLTSHFFSKNPLIFEYFQGEYPQHIKDILEIKRKNNNT